MRSVPGLCVKHLMSNDVESPCTQVLGLCFAAVAAARRAHVGTNASGIVVVAVMVRVVFVILCSARGRFALSGTSLRDRTW